MDIKERIVSLLIELTGAQELRENDDIDLIANDILDSLAFIELIDMLNEEYDIEIQPTQVDKEVWHSVDSIAKLVATMIK